MCTITETDINGLAALRADATNNLDWSSPFILPEWLKVWSQIFGQGNHPCISVIKDGEKVIGVAPLQLKDHTAHFLGATDVCDYQDFIVATGSESDFFKTILDYMKENNITGLDLKHVRPDSLTMTALLPLAKERGYTVESLRDDVSVEMDLPNTFEGYLDSLDTKQRHEIRRKLRRLTEEGNITYRFIEKGHGLTSGMGLFYKMFTESREDKAAFLTERMKYYFDLLSDRLAEIGLFRLGVLELDEKPVAEIICFDYNNTIYLYNSGYDPQYVTLSAGLLSKVYAIKDSIEKGKKKFDFLKGNEIYKYRLGGQEVPLYRCLIGIK
jgi:CelD/BcsL family acetyltransferase involved in cellulose biosynthesis